MGIAASITPHTLVVCIDKRERGIGMQTILTKAGFRVVVAVTLYEAMQLIAQEMPHLVICEALLSDGTAGTLYDRLAQHEMLRKTPIMVHVLKKTKEELTPLAGRKFAGFFLGPFEPQGFLNKVQEIVAGHSAVSPYFVNLESKGLSSDLTISIEANIVGRSGEQLVARSSSEVDAAASMLCVPQNPDFGPAVLRMATNLREGDEVFNLFPINRIIGAGRKWIMSLPEIAMGSTQAAKAERKTLHKVLFFEPSEARFEGFREILKGYDIDLIHARSLSIASVMLKRDSESLSACYLHELLNDASALEWKNVFARMPANKRPPLIIGTSSISARSQGGVRYIKRPFGIGLFVEMLQASFERASELSQAVGKAGNTQTNGVPVRFQAPANLVGVDEAGGVLRLRFPLLKGCRLSIQHAFLSSAWDGDTVVQIVGTASDSASADVWHARFESVSVGSSKVKYWEKITKLLDVADAGRAAAENADDKLALDKSA